MLLHGFLVHVFRNFGTFYDFAVNERLSPLRPLQSKPRHTPAMARRLRSPCSLNGSTALQPGEGPAGKAVHEVLHRFARKLFSLVSLVDEYHQLADRCVKAHMFKVFGHFLNRFVQCTFEIVRTLAFHDFRVQLTVVPDKQAPYAGEETKRSFNAVGVPWLSCFQRPHEHLVHARVSAPYSLTISSGLMTLPRDLLIFHYCCPGSYPD